MTTVEDVCSGNWSDWTVCDAVCNPDYDSATGKKKKIYTIKKPLNDKSIKTIETDMPCTKSCPVNCTGKYGNWGECVGTCNNNQKETEGEEKRDYIITRPATNGGLECSQNEITSRKCKKICPVNCVGEWSGWSECVTPACNGKDPFINGKKTRRYTIITPASNGGASCNIENGKIETADCKKECSVNSIFFWIAVVAVPVLLLVIIIIFYYNSKHNKAAVDVPAIEPVSISNTKSVAPGHSGARTQVQSSASGRHSAPARTGHGHG